MAKTKRTKRKYTVRPKKLCIKCGPSVGAKTVEANFYKSYSELHADGYLPICKDCIWEIVRDEKTDTLDIEKFKYLLRQIDKPYISSVMRSTIEEYNKKNVGKVVDEDARRKIVGIYFKNINTLKQFSGLDWQGGLEWEERAKEDKPPIIETGYEFPDGDGISETAQGPAPAKEKDATKEKVYYLDDSYDFEPTKEIINLFGEGFTANAYRRMWEKYNTLKEAYPTTSVFHEEALATYVRYKVMEEIAIATGDSEKAKLWSERADKASAKAKINPSQFKKEDLEGGLTSFSEMALAIEQAVDIIPILPRFRFRPNDAVDFTIWCYVNYMRRLEDKPLCTYEELYGFYDERKRDYIEQYGDPYGIFEDDPTEKLRETVKGFITLPDDIENATEDEPEEVIIGGD